MELASESNALLFPANDLYCKFACETALSNSHLLHVTITCAAGALLVILIAVEMKQNFD